MHRLKTLLPLMVIGLSVALNASFADARGGNSVIESGVVDLDQDGNVIVVTLDEETLYPSNGNGLLDAGQIAPGDEVQVRIVTDRGHKHRGHVTILK